MKKYIITAFICFVVGIAYAATIWEGDVDSAWDNSGNWDNGVPNLGNDGTINAGAGSDPTINQTTALTNTTVNQNGRTVTATRMGSVNRIVFGGGTGSASTWNLDGGIFNVTASVGLQLTRESVFNVAGGTYNGGGYDIDNDEWNGGTLSMSSGMITNVNDIFIGNRNFLYVSGGTLYADTLQIGNNTVAMPSYDEATITGGDVYITDMYVQWGDASSKYGRWEFAAGDGFLSADTLNFRAHSAAANDDGRPYAYIDFTNANWTGSFYIPGLSSVSDYWNAMGTGEFVRINGQATDESTFNSTFRTTGSGLALVPEPGITALLLSGFAMIRFLRRRKRG